MSQCRKWSRKYYGLMFGAVVSPSLYGVSLNILGNLGKLHDINLLNLICFASLVMRRNGRLGANS